MEVFGTPKGESIFYRLEKAEKPKRLEIEKCI